METQLLRIHYLNMNCKVYFNGHYFWNMSLSLVTKPSQVYINPDLKYSQLIVSVCDVETWAEILFELNG